MERGESQWVSLERHRIWSWQVCSESTANSGTLSELVSSSTKCRWHHFCLGVYWWFEGLVPYWYKTISTPDLLLLLLIMMSLYMTFSAFSLISLTYHRYVGIWKYEQLSILFYSLQHAKNKTKFTHIRIGIKNTLKFKTRCKLLQRVSLIGIKTFLTALDFKILAIVTVCKCFFSWFKKKLQSSLSRNTLDIINN